MNYRNVRSQNKVSSRLIHGLPHIRNPRMCGAPTMEGLSVVPTGLGIPIVGIVVTFVPGNGLDIYAALGSACRLVSGRQRPIRLCMTANDSGHEAEMIFEN